MKIQHGRSVYTLLELKPGQPIGQASWFMASTTAPEEVNPINGIYVPAVVLRQAIKELSHGE